MPTYFGMGYALPKKRVNAMKVFLDKKLGGKRNK